MSIPKRTKYMFTLVYSVGTNKKHIYPHLFASDRSNTITNQSTKHTKVKHFYSFSIVGCNICGCNVNPMPATILHIHSFAYSSIIILQLSFTFLLFFFSYVQLCLIMSKSIFLLFFPAIAHA